MRWPDKDHPVWKLIPLAQAAISLLGLMWMTAHGLEGQHTTGIDRADLAGAAGTAGLGHYLYTVWQSRNS